MSYNKKLSVGNQFSTWTLGWLTVCDDWKQAGEIYITDYRKDFGLTLFILMISREEIK